MATAPKGYKLSRAAQRDQFGTRQIDAGAPQSAQDTTPSGITARFRQAGVASGNPLRVAEAERWQEMFPQSNYSKNVFAQLRDRRPAESPLEAMNSFNQGTLPLQGTRPLPPGASRPIMVPTPSLPSLLPQTSIAAADDYLGGGSFATDPIVGLFGSLRGRARRPSILDGASQWVAAV